MGRWVGRSMSARALTEADRLRLSFARREQRMPVTELRAEALVAAARTTQGKRAAQGSSSIPALLMT
jgi:hypothetical protein